VPTELDVKLRAKALALIDRFGQRPTSYQKKTKGAFSPTSDRAVLTYEDVTSTVNKLSPPEIMTHGMLRGLPEGLVSVGDCTTFMAAKDATQIPGVGDRIVFQGLTSKLWEVVRVTPLVSGEQKAAWQLFCTAVTTGSGN
jgi:hypothetical protein